MVENTLQNVKKWLLPPEFASDLERAKDLREEGTTGWLFDMKPFNDWVEGKNVNGGANDNVLWIRGMIMPDKRVNIGQTLTMSRKPRMWKNSPRRITD